MPSHVPRYLEPYKKRELLKRRQRVLLQAIKSGARRASLARLAAKVREAQLAVIKAQRLLIGDKHLLVTNTPNPQVVRQLANLDAQEARWRSITDVEIVAECGGAASQD